ncbi:MAG: 7-cyano-7-deazaguanine synthase QueC [Sphingomonadaceae bacterium]|uniref:7-cyano-7-deazaguanine synthase QueC n=1 Tax=Thermaurantiacus sp. TaxID=2820283 RepID=UPI00298F2AF5|nr:7-cyano-7-deazaguanine synthase QueC [Thermaurantiacus sp.]MCS6987130.1 7-cyano-7-deazaguanine synthase QueC [Sphingomonadaceae bacterium]MDW8415836.1 7-cyano-7-deazaguanine synthase QueC [Thermaurantiacus sp.]
MTTPVERPLAALAGRPVVALLSGGLDSAVATAMAMQAGAHMTALSVDYGQRHARELEAARALARALRLDRHVVVPLDLRAIGGSALTADIAVPKEGPSPGIPPTYVPARNTLFLSLALALAEATGAQDLLIGVNALDYSGYPDCRPAFVEAFERLAGLATRAGVEGTARFRVHAPLLHLNKAQIVSQGIAAGLDLGLTWSCYDPTPDGRHCGLCDSCRLRRKGFLEAGVPDPTDYARCPTP